MIFYLHIVIPPLPFNDPLMTHWTNNDAQKESSTVYHTGGEVVVGLGVQNGGLWNDSHSVRLPASRPYLRSGPYELVSWVYRLSGTSDLLVGFDEWDIFCTVRGI